MKAYALLAALSVISTTKGIPVIFITTLTEADNVEYGFLKHKVSIVANDSLCK